MKQTFILSLMGLVLTGCLPYNGYYASNPSYSGYYQEANYQQGFKNPYQAGQASYSNNQGAFHAQQTEPQEPKVYSHNFEQGISDDPSFKVQDPDMYTSSYQNQLEPSYFNANQKAARHEKAYLGVGRGYVGKPMPVFEQPGYNNTSSKLIMPRAWRMAHPSIGKGLELISQEERLVFNQALNTVSVKKPSQITIVGTPVTIISLTNASAANSQGLLCKDVYLAKATQGAVENMWSKFCRYPNWNEWVLTKW